MLVRPLNGVALATAAAIILVAGTACKSPGYCSCDTDSFNVFAWGANVIPTPAPADTSAKALVTFNAITLVYVYNITAAPSGTIDSIALYEVAAGEPLPASASAILCAGASSCAIGSGTATLVGVVTTTSIETPLRSYGMQLVFFTTTAQKAAGGAMRGTMYQPH